LEFSISVAEQGLSFSREESAGDRRWEPCCHDSGGLLARKQQQDTLWRQPLDRHRKGKAERTEGKQIFEHYRLPWSKTGQQTGGRVTRRSQKKTVKYEIDDARSFWVQLGRLQTPDC